MTMAALMLAVMYFTPIWHIALTAPQYPEGLGLRIHIDTIVGDKPNDLANINALNHYIGMRPIDASSFAELRWLPWLVGVLVLFGLAAALTGRRRLAIAWIAGVLLLAAAGLADMYRWGYEYGHDLDTENAIIKVPGMAYQPPLIGTKQLLNFRAASWPAEGAIAAGVALLFGVAAVVASRRRTVLAATAGGALFAAACGAGGPRPIAYGRENCDYCRMAISDARFGAELITTTGAVKVFDSVECLVSYYLDAVSRGDVREAYVTDFRRPGTFIVADRARFLRGGPGSPMGLSLTAFASDAEAATARDELGGGELLAWSDVLDFVSRERMPAAPPETAGAR
jgi:copper chaperone NosL